MIIFENKGALDVRSITSFGVSVKEGDNPIGFFGTGLKYAIAVLVRHRQQVTIQTGGALYTFSPKEQTIRGKAFEFVAMKVQAAADGQADAETKEEILSFTTELGKQWKLWQAYRELACNCMDEGGIIYKACGPATTPAHDTVVSVEGGLFEEVYDNRQDFILDPNPNAPVYQEVEFRPKRSMKGIYFRGVLVSQPEKPTLFQYNILSKITLTEDRTAANNFEISAAIVKAVLVCRDKAVLKSIITASTGFYEAHLDMAGWGIEPSQEFLEVCEELAATDRFRMNQTAFECYKHWAQKGFAPAPLTLTRVQQQMLEKAKAFCTQIGFAVEEYPVIPVQSLGTEGLGLAESGNIYIAERAFSLGGTKQVASTLIEEFVHLRYGYSDETRAMQNFLFDKLVSLGEELRGEPL